MRRIDAPATAASDYNAWCDFLESKVDFWMNVSVLHTKEHCSRVLLYALLIADKIGVTDKEKEVLCHAAVFHDSRRQDDWLDVGHGQRAADYYQSYCTENGLEYHPWSYDIMAWHDRDDMLGRDAMKDEPTGREILLYQIFKDADALDRFRLGTGGLDVKYLRTQAAIDLYGYAHDLWFDYFANESQ